MFYFGVFFLEKVGFLGENYKAQQTDSRYPFVASFEAMNTLKYWWDVALSILFSIGLVEKDKGMIKTCECG